MPSSEWLESPESRDSGGVLPSPLSPLISHQGTVPCREVLGQCRYNVCHQVLTLRMEVAQDLSKLQSDTRFVFYFRNKLRTVNHLY